jgi:hypothetical protein
VILVNAVKIMAIGNMNEDNSVITVNMVKIIIMENTVHGEDNIFIITVNMMK